MHNLYDYRQLLKSNVQKEIRGKYKGSFLGILWSFINPLLMTLVYALVFSVIMRSTQDNFVTFLIIAILPWNYFTVTISTGTASILMNAGIIKKIYFPREILPVSINTSGLINYLISCLIILIFLVVTGIGFSWYLIFFPLVLIIQYIFQLGIILITSAIEIYVRDFEYIIQFILNLMFYATPILYESNAFDGKFFGEILKLNPMATIINSYRDIFFYQSMPRIKSLLIVFALSIVLLYLGLLIFKKLEKGFAEEV